MNEKAWTGASSSFCLNKSVNDFQNYERDDWQGGWDLTGCWKPPWFGTMISMIEQRQVKGKREGNSQNMLGCSGGCRSNWCGGKGIAQVVYERWVDGIVVSSQRPSPIGVSGNLSQSATAEMLNQVSLA